jgi:hypothetical protein
MELNKIIQTRHVYQALQQSIQQQVKLEFWVIGIWLFNPLWG